jgi:hypothetical protein
MVLSISFLLSAELSNKIEISLGAIINDGNLPTNSTRLDIDLSSTFILFLVDTEELISIL